MALFTRSDEENRRQARQAISRSRSPRLTHSEAREQIMPPSVKTPAPEEDEKKDKELMDQIRKWRRQGRFERIA